MLKKLIYSLLTGLFVCISGLNAQNELENPDEINGRNLDGEILQYAVPFLTIAPDSRAGAMGDAGAATSPDVNSIHWNAAKYAMIEDNAGISISYTPWLRKLVNDINLFHLAGFYRLDDKQVIAGSLLYFSLGEITFTDWYGTVYGQHIPNEFALDASYSRYLSEKLSMGMTFRFIRSDLTGGQTSESKAGITGAADISIYYQTDIEIDEKPAQLAFGTSITNIGPKISYSVDNQDEEFIPINLRIGGRLTMDIDEYNKISFAADINKLLVPTTPVYGDVIDTTTEEREILKGYDPDVSIPVGMLHSFYDAPGGFKEEMQELMFSVGLEYWYSNQFAIRTGYFYEHQNKGGRKFLTLGIGLKLNVLSMDFAYIVPSGLRDSPLANTIRFSLLFNINTK